LFLGNFRGFCNDIRDKRLQNAISARLPLAIANLRAKSASEEPLDIANC
jgi:hypothetical protein